MVYRQIVNASALESVIEMPPMFRSRKLEVTIRAIEGKTSFPQIAPDDLDALLAGSVTQSLIGIIPDKGMSLAEYRAERLKKHERTD
jgi:hypothetical protein